MNREKIRRLEAEAEARGKWTRHHPIGGRKPYPVLIWHDDGGVTGSIRYYEPGRVPLCEEVEYGCRVDVLDPGV